MIRKLKIVGLLLGLIPCFLNAKGDRKTFSAYNFSKGLDSYHNPTTLPDGYVQDSQNVLFDSKSPISKRNGYSVTWTTKSYSYTGLWTYTDATNTSWQLARSSDQITANNLSGTSIIISTVSSSNIISETNAFGNAYFVDQSQGVYFWNGTSTTYVSGSPRGSIIAQFHNRLWVTGAAVPNGNQLYGSGYYSGSNWTTGLNATDPVQYSIGLQDNFDNVTAEYVYLDTLYLFKHYSIFAVYGFDQTNFQISQLTQECGCVDGNSIQTFNGGLKFVSLRGVEDFNGYTCKRISDPIKNKVDPGIQAGGFSQQSWVQSQTTDWNSGTISPSGSLSIALASPGLTVSTFTFSISSSYWNVLNNGFESNTGLFGTLNNWSTSSSKWSPSNGFSTHSGVTYDCGSGSPRTGSWMAQAVTSNASASPFMDVKVVDYSGGTTIYEETEGGWSNACSWFPITLPIANSTGVVAYVQFGLDSNTYTMRSSTFTIGGDVRFYEMTGRVTDASGSSYYAVIDDVLDGVSSYVSSATFVANPGYVRTNATWTSGNPVVSIQQSANSLAGPWTTLTTSTGTDISFSKNYLRTTEIFTRSGTDTGVTDLTNITVVGNSTGSFVSQTHNVGAISSFGNFQVDESLNNGSIAYTICASSSASMSPKSCAIQTKNSQITIATNTFVQWSATFTATAAQLTTLNSGTVQWFSGTKAIPMSSVVWDNRYWLSLTTTTVDTTNDAVLVLNSVGGWSVFDIHAGAFTLYKNSLYHADSRATGNIYLDNQGWADNGSPINAYLTSKNLSLGDLASDSYLYVLYPVSQNTGSCAMSAQYSLDGSPNLYSLGTPLLSEFGALSSVRLPFPIDNSHQVFGQSVDFNFGTNDAQCDWQFLGFQGISRERPEQ